MRNRIIAGSIFGLFAVCFVLAADYEVIPFNEYRYQNPLVTLLFALINLPIIIVMSLSGAGFSRSISVSLFFLWWFIIGFTLCWILEKLRDTRRTP
jgi:hypothetical protein